MYVISIPQTKFRMFMPEGNINIVSQHQTILQARIKDEALLRQPVVALCLFTAAPAMLVCVLPWK